MKKTLRILPLLILVVVVFVPQMASAGDLTEGCFPVVDCDAGEDFYGGQCNPELNSVDGTMPSCVSVNGAAPAGKAWAFSCDAGCYLNVGGGAVDTCPGGVMVNEECLIKLSVLDDSEDIFSVGNGAYKIWDANELSEVVHVPNVGCPNGTIPISSSTSSTGWVCSSSVTKVGIGTDSPSSALEVLTDGYYLLRLTDSRASGNRGPHMEFRDGTAATAFLGYIHSWTSAYRNNSFEIRPAVGGRVNFYDGSGANTSDMTMTILNNGNVGIGTYTPSDKLTVSGNARLSGSVRADGGVYVDGRMMIRNDGYYHRAQSTDGAHYGFFEGVDDSGSRGFYLGWGNGADRVDLNLDSASKLGITGGNVGIGMTNPAYLLDVNGQANVDAICLQEGTCYTSWATMVGDNSLWTENSGNVYRSTGNVGIGMSTPHDKLEVAGAVIATGANQFRAIGGNYGTFLRNDGSNTYFLLTNPGDQYGSWNSLRPFRINNASGRVYIGNGLTANNLDVTGPANLNIGKTGAALRVNGAEALWFNNDYFSWGYGGTKNYFADSVGIGTTNPLQKLHVNGNAKLNNLEINGSGAYIGSNVYYNSGWKYRTTGTATAIRHNTGGDFQFMTAPSGSAGATASLSTRMYIKNNGYVGIGTTAPIGPLHIRTDVDAGPTESSASLVIGNPDAAHTEFDGNEIMAKSSASTSGTLYLQQNGGDLRVNDTQLMVDDSTNRVGIGTGAPTHTLDVAGQANVDAICINNGTCYTSWTSMIGDNSLWKLSGSNVYRSSGKVGIGTTAPATPLEVSTSGYTLLRLTDSRTTGSRGPHMEFSDGNGTRAYIDYIHEWTSAYRDNAFEFRPAVGGRVNFYDGSGADPQDMTMTILNNGNVGIGLGNDNPAYQLDVAGALNLNKGKTGKALYVNGKEALWSNDDYFSWGYGGSQNIFRDKVFIGASGLAEHTLDVAGDMGLSSTSPTFKFNDTTSAAHDFWIHANSNNFYILADRNNDDSWSEGVFPMQLEADTNMGYMFGQKIWTAGTDGAGSGLDADSLDGKSSASFVATAGDTMSGPLSSTTFTVPNPNNSSASASLSWKSDVARMRIGGSGAGAGNGFDIQGPGDTSYMRIRNGYLDLSGKEALRSNDSWLRLNQNGDFTSGVHTPGNFYASGSVRADGGVYVDGKLMIFNDGAAHAAQYQNNYRYGYFEGVRLDGRRGFYLGYGDGEDLVHLYLDNANDLGITGGNVGINTNFPTERLDVDGDIAISGKQAFQGTDSWLRLNNDSDFTSGTYTPGLFRANGGFQVDDKWSIANNNYWHRAQSTVTNHYGYFEGLRSDGRRGFYLGYGNGSSTVNLNLDYASNLYISGGYVGIGVSDPLYPLDISGGDTGARIKNATGITTHISHRQPRFSGGTVVFDSYGIYTTHSVAVGGVKLTSDARLKKNIESLEDASSIIEKLNPVSFEWKDSQRVGTTLGFIAQEVEDVLPEAVVIPANESDYYLLDYEMIIPVLTKAMQEQQAIIEDLQLQINELKNKQ